MSLFEWTEALSVGVPALDDQHKALIDIINDLYDAKISGKADSVLLDIVARLKDYAETHFSFEEELMEQKDYAGLRNHQVEHWEFIKKVRTFDLGIKMGKLDVDADVIQFLKAWLIQHINGTDKQYSVVLA